MVDSEVLEQEDYEVKIGSFNGPMDLLVYLVQKKEMTLDQIPIAEIADDFLKWVNEYSETDLSKAGDFLFMASRLMALKVQELLPAEERDPETIEEYNEDREKLMQEMLEYQRFKQVAGGLQEMEAKNFGTYSRGRLEKTQNDDDTLADANIWQLFRAYQKSLKTKISETIHHIELDYVTIQDRQQAINNFLNANGRALFEDLLDNDSHPIVAAVTFMAMLEMIKTDEIVFRQSELFGPIWIYRKKNNPEYADEMAHETVFFSKDPEVKAGLVETIRSQAIARSKEKSVGDLAATMREAVLWTERGRNVTEEDLNAMLEGREDISEVQENPFADMIAEADAVEGITTPAATEQPSAEQVPTEISTAEQPVAEQSTIPEDSPVLTKSAIPDFGTNDDSSLEDYTHTIEPVEEPSGEDETDDSSVTSTAESSTTENTLQGLSEENVKQMSDEEFATFMQKAQAFYDNADSAKSQTNSNLPSDVSDDVPSITKSTYQEKPEEIKEAKPKKKSFMPEEGEGGMTEEEYQAYLAEHGDDDEDEEGPVVYGADKN
ncbi:MAG: segregation/condensation protein A [Fibrobacter sp.]|nr:segregation/condensation protein A [Fibrobacter sp.]